MAKDPKNYSIEDLIRKSFYIDNTGKVYIKGKLEGTSSTSDEKVKVSNNDLKADYLKNKLISNDTDVLNIVEKNDGSNEQIELQLKYDNETIEKGLNGLKTKYDNVTIKKGTNGLEVGYDDETITKGTNGLQAKYDNETIIKGTNGLEVKYDNNTIKKGTNGIYVVDNTTNQKIEIKKNNTNIGTRKTINFIEGTNITLNVSDDPTNDKIDIEIISSGGTGGGLITEQYETVEILSNNITGLNLVGLIKDTDGNYKIEKRSDKIISYGNITTDYISNKSGFIKFEDNTFFIVTSDSSGNISLKYCQIGLNTIQIIKNFDNLITGTDGYLGGGILNDEILVIVYNNGTNVYIKTYKINGTGTSLTLSLLNSGTFGINADTTAIKKLKIYEYDNKLFLILGYKNSSTTYQSFKSVIVTSGGNISSGTQININDFVGLVDDFDILFLENYYGYYSIVGLLDSGTGVRYIYYTTQDGNVFFKNKVIIKNDTYDNNLNYKKITVFNDLIIIFGNNTSDNYGFIMVYKFVVDDSGTIKTYPFGYWKLGTTQTDYVIHKINDNYLVFSTTASNLFYGIKYINGKFFLQRLGYLYVDDGNDNHLIYLNGKYLSLRPTQTTTISYFRGFNYFDSIGIVFGTKSAGDLCDVYLFGQKIPLSTFSSVDTTKRINKNLYLNDNLRFYHKKYNNNEWFKDLCYGYATKYNLILYENK